MANADPNTPSSMSGSPRTSWLERFAENTMPIPPSTCLVWVGTYRGNGYGILTVNGRTECAHRLAWGLAHGPIPDGLPVLHKCDNPACVNPDHLLLGARFERRSPRLSLEARFWSNVEKTDGCWGWTAATSKGYGVISYKNRQKRAHRFAWELANGSIPGGLSVCHHCDNPVCVRPDHLFLGTTGDNIRDAASKGRLVSQTNPEKVRRGEQHPKARMDFIKVREARSLHGTGMGYIRISRRFGVCASTIQKIIEGRTWREVPA